MNVVAEPKVLISYTWRDDPTNPDPLARGFALAEKLRGAGLDCRIDQYFHQSLHGFAPPERRPGDILEPWIVWAKEQIQDVDFVLLLCSPAYATTTWELSTGQVLTWDEWHSLSDDSRAQLQSGSKKVPYTWWDWHFMAQAL